MQRSYTYTDDSIILALLKGVIRLDYLIIHIYVVKELNKRKQVWIKHKGVKRKWNSPKMTSLDRLMKHILHTLTDFR